MHLKYCQKSGLNVTVLLKMGVKGLTKSLFFKIAQFAHTRKIQYMNFVMENYVN